MSLVAWSWFELKSVADSEVWSMLCVIFAVHQGSKFYVNEERKERRIQERIVIQQQQLSRLMEQQKAAALVKASLWLFTKSIISAVTILVSQNRFNFLSKNRDSIRFLVYPKTSAGAVYRTVPKPHFIDALTHGFLDLKCSCINPKDASC